MQYFMIYSGVWIAHLQIFSPQLFPTNATGSQQTFYECLPNSLNACTS